MSHEDPATLRQAVALLPAGHPARVLLETEIHDIEQAQPVTGFHIRCNKCNGEDIRLGKDITFYSEETGWDGSVFLHCRKCGATADVYDSAELP